MAEQVSRLPPLPDPLPAAVQELFAERIKRSGRILNIHHTFGHAPKLSWASMQMAMALRFLYRFAMAMAFPCRSVKATAMQFPCRRG